MRAVAHARVADQPHAALRRAGFHLSACAGQPSVQRWKFRASRSSLISHFIAIIREVLAAPIVGEAAARGWNEAEFLKPSALKPLLARIEKGLVLRRLGRLEEEDRRALREVLDEILGR
ncbi:MAG: hypothetical protein AB1486_33695 [Planctomycetota bacterium]